MKQRDTYVDVAKGLCMLLIICIHSEVFGVIGMPLTFIAVPMFFFLSGFYDRSERPWSQWVGKSAKTLILPAVIWCVIGTAYLALLSYIKCRSVEFSFDIVSPCHGDGPAWFLLSLFFVKIIMGGVLRLKLPQYILLPLCFGIGYLGSAYQMPLNIDEALAAIPLYYCGKQLYPYLNKVVNMWTALIGFITLMLFVFTPYYYNIGPSNPLFYPYYLSALGGALFVFLFILYISRLLRNLKTIRMYGEKTLGIMLTHSLMCHTAAIVLNRFFEKGSTTWVVCFLIAYVVIVMFSYYLTIMIEKYCPVLLGKKNTNSPTHLRE